jgi:hypothetical protein
MSHCAEDPTVEDLKSHLIDSSLCYVKLRVHVEKHDNTNEENLPTTINHIA